MSTTSIQQLQRALEIAEQISALENELKAVLAGNVTEEAPAPAAKPAPKRTKARKQRTVSPEARARMAAAQKNRRNREKRGQ